MKPETTNAPICEAGYHAGSGSREKSRAMLEMTPTENRVGGTGAEVRYAVVPCSLGFLLVAATSRGICSVRFGDDAELLGTELRRDYPRARLVQGEPALNARVETIVAVAEHGVPANHHLSLDIRGTAFQRRVWRELQKIRAGETATYADIGARVGNTKASRAVARACAANPLAVLIPCHRVIRKDGSLGGYRWGIKRKQELLRREHAA